jgi:hypothetical protein
MESGEENHARNLACPVFQKSPMLSAPLCQTLGMKLFLLIAIFDTCVHTETKEFRYSRNLLKIKGFENDPLPV